ncbi:MAG: hypothetical protein ACXIUZ_02075 [Lysobacteraceae bacterium]
MKTLTITAGIEQDANGRPVRDVAAKVREVRRLLAVTFGGYTETATAGGWVNDAGELIEESGRRWDILAEDASQAEAVASAVASILKQACVVLAITDHDRAAFVAPMPIPAAASA